MPDTYRVVQLKLFLHKTLGGFSPSTGESWHQAIARSYLAGDKVEVMLAEIGVDEMTIYRSLARQSIALRTAS